MNIKNALIFVGKNKRKELSIKKTTKNEISFTSLIGIKGMIINRYEILKIRFIKRNELFLLNFIV